MNSPSLLCLYVDNPLSSADFYASLLGQKPVEASPGFAMFVLDGGLNLGLWKRADVEPRVDGTTATSELGIRLSDNPAVDATFATWKSKGLKIAQTPTRMDFGYTFVALDPDGHRLRVYAPALA
jgi:predicted enzyme related to lactoylglutathione lyase